MFFLSSDSINILRMPMHGALAKSIAKSKVAPLRKTEKNSLGQEPTSALLACQCSAGAMLSMLEKYLNVSVQP